MGVGPPARALTPGLEAAIEILPAWHEVALAAHLASANELGEVE